MIPKKERRYTVSIRHQQRQLESACMSKLLNEITNNAGQPGKSKEVNTVDHEIVVCD